MLFISFIAIENNDRLKFPGTKWKGMREGEEEKNRWSIFFIVKIYIEYISKIVNKINKTPLRNPETLINEEDVS